MTGAVQSGGGTASNAYHYDPAGNRLSETTATATWAGQFNNVNQLTALSASPTATTIAGHTTAPTSSVTINAIPASITDSTNFTANVPLPTGTNLVSVVAQPSASRAPPVTQRLQVVAAGGSSTALTYDANGNTLTDESGNSYQWDALDQLVKTTYPSGATSNFTYDAFGRRAQVCEYDSSHTLVSTTNELWVGGTLGEERDGSNTVTKRFFSQGEQQAGTAYYYAQDHLGSVHELVDGSGNLVSRLSYDPYGKTNLVSGTTLPTMQYAGYYQHTASGLSLTLYRAYNSHTGRWLNRDPIGENGGINLYGYVDNDPIDESDPFGLCPQTVWEEAFGDGSDHYRQALLSGFQSGFTFASFFAGGEAVGAFKGISIVVRSARTIKAAKDVVSGVSRNSANKPYSSSRPPYGKGQVDNVWENAKQDNGRVYDPHTGEELFWDRSQPRNGQWDMGHQGRTYKDLFDDYMEGKITKEEFLKEYRDPKNYVPQSVSGNRSRRYD